MPEIEASLRAQIRLRARGCCEYFGISERVTLAEHEIDHVIAVKHGGLTVAENLARGGSDHVGPGHQELARFHVGRRDSEG